MSVGQWFNSMNETIRKMVGRDKSMNEIIFGPNSSKLMHDTQVCIIGAGPAGATLSHFLSKQKIAHVLIDKASFPRDKICGDGITVDVLNVLKRLSPDLLADFASQAEMLPSWGFCFHSANGKELRYDFKDSGFQYAPFYTSRRLDLDNFLVSRLDNTYCTFLPATKVTGIDRQSDGVEVKAESNEGTLRIKSKMIVGAEGEKPVVTRHLNLEHFREKQYLIGGLRVYYKNVEGFNPGNHLEFFFDKRLLPGYFWSFPLTENEANVGLGMVSTAISARKVNLKKMLDVMLETHPRVSEMFAHAEPMEKTKGWGLPIITAKRTIAGERYALVGDAAGMIEPFTGKGIGPGMMSARICSEHLTAALATKDYDLKLYGEHMYRYYSSEIKTGYTLQKTLKYPPVLNAVIGLSNLSAIKKWSHQKMVKEWSKWM